MFSTSGGALGKKKGKCRWSSPHFSAVGGERGGGERGSLTPTILLVHKERISISFLSYWPGGKKGGGGRKGRRGGGDRL